VDCFNLYNHELSKCEPKWWSVCCCRGACAPCPVMVTISCACGETHFEVWFWSFKFCNLVSYWQLAFLVLFHLDSWMIVLYWDWLWLLWNHCCFLVSRRTISFFCINFVSGPYKWENSDIIGNVFHDKTFFTTPSAGMVFTGHNDHV